MSRRLAAAPRCTLPGAMVVALVGFVVVVGAAVPCRAETPAEPGAPEQSMVSGGFGYAAGAALLSDTGGFSWSASDRTAVVAAWARHYLPSESFADHVGWNGAVDTCIADSVSSEFLGDTLRRINWFRAQAGVTADVAGDPVLDAKAQAAALIMAKEDALSHQPATDFPANPCLSADGNAAAAKSNLSLGAFGPRAINSLMRDAGAGNSAVGHRRWTLYLRQKAMGNGAIPPTANHLSAHVQYVLAPFKPAQPAQAVPWPNEGFVPWQVVPSDSATPPRWSFSYPGADFSSATVTVERLGNGGGFLATTKETVVNGYGDNTVAWQTNGVPAVTPLSDTTYHVVVSGVASIPTTTFSYDITVIDPYDLGIDLQPAGPAKPTVGAISSYSFPGVAEADGYTVRRSRAVAGTWSEGAEDSPPPAIVDDTSASYSLRETAAHASGSKSFHLTLPSFEESQQDFRIDRIVVPTASSVLHFADLRRCATDATVLAAQISRNGNSWETLWSRSGRASLTCTPALDWDAAFQSVNVPIPARYAGSTVALRFLLTATTSIFADSGTGSGFYIDDISVTDSEELVGAVEDSLPASATAFGLTPVDQNPLWLQVQARIDTVSYEWSTPTVVAPMRLCGDATGDGKITVSDALVALRTAVNLATCPLILCDANLSGTITIADALLILRRAVGVPAVVLNCPTA